MASPILHMVYTLMEVGRMSKGKLQCLAQQYTGIIQMKVIEFFFGFLFGLGLWGLTLMILLILN